MKIILLALVILGSFNAFSREEKKVIYTYKQYEKFDFDDLNIEGEAGAPNDLSITPIHEKKYTNRLPYRKSFIMEIRKGIERVR
jgi:hypothetical protein